MFDATNCAPALPTTLTLEEAKQRLTTFIETKAAAVDAVLDTSPSILDFLTQGLPLCVRMVCESDPHDVDQALELLDTAQAELAAAVNARHYLNDTDRLRELNLTAALVVDSAYSVMNAIDDCVVCESFTTARYATKCYQAYADRYQQLMERIQTLPNNMHITGIMEEIAYYDAMVTLAEAKLASHIDWLKAKHPSS